MTSANIFRSGSRCRRSRDCSGPQQRDLMGEQIDSRHAGNDLANSRDTPMHTKIIESSE